MTPNQISAALRDIATKIANSQKPSRQLVAAALTRVLAAIEDPRAEQKRQQELEKKTEETLKKTQDDLGKRMEDLVKKGVSGDDITKAVGDMEREFGDLERKSKMR